MALTSGFYNSIDGDRTYDAEQMSAIFDGIINDGVLMGVGNMFSVRVANETKGWLNIDTGRAWFNSTWVYNDSVAFVQLADSDSLLDRIDAVVIEIDHSEAVRAATIKRVTGTAASSPVNPSMTNTDEVHQYPLAYIHRTAGTNKISASDITNAVGTSECPYVTGLLQVHSIDNLVAQWQAQWDEWFSNASTTGEADLSSFLTRMRNEVNTWFQQVKNTLGEDAATNLAVQIVEIQNRLDNINTTYDSELSTTSENPIQNKPVATAINTLTEAVNGKATSDHTHSNYLDKSGGTMSGKLVANNGTDYAVYKVRNIALGTSASTPTGKGDLLGVYS